MKKETYDKMFFSCVGILIGIFFVMIFMFGWLNQIRYSVQFKINGYTKENAVAICSGKDLKGTTFCINSFIRGIYKFKQTSDKEYVSFEKLKEVGGDCLNWKNLICEIAKGVNYGCTSVVFPIEIRDNIHYKHTYAILHSPEGYSNFDGKEVNIIFYD